MASQVFSLVGGQMQPRGAGITGVNGEPIPTPHKRQEPALIIWHPDRQQFIEGSTSSFPVTHRVDSRAGVQMAEAGANWSQGTDFNRRPAAYKAAALPLSYQGTRDRV